MERLMGKIVDVEEVQDALNRAARDAKHGPSDVRAGRFVHRDARDGRFVAGRDKDKPRSASAPARRRK
jgi:hypothetical protein